jgi:hypothetical protein
VKLAYRKDVRKKRTGWDVTRAIAASDTVRKPMITLPRLKWMEERNGEKPALDPDGAGREAGIGSGPRREVGPPAQGGAEISTLAVPAGEERAATAGPGEPEVAGVYEEEIGG